MNIKKKILALVVGFAVFTGGSAVALDLPDALKIDGLSVSGTIQTGLQVAGTTHDKGSENAGVDSGAENPSAFAYSDDIGDGTPFRAQLVLQYEKENIGIKTRFRYQPVDGGTGTGASSNFGNPFSTAAGTINKAFIWGKLLDKTVKVTAGKALDESWALFYSDYDNDAGGTNTGFDGKDGVKVEYTGIKGLNVGAFYGAGNLFRDATSGYDGDVDYSDRRLVIGAKYDHPAFAAVLSIYHNFVDLATPESGNRNYKFWNGGKDVNPMTAVDNALPNTTNVLLGGQLKPTDSLPLQVDLSVLITGLGSMTANKDLYDGEDIPGAYKKGNYNPYWGLQPKIKAAYDINDKLSIAAELTGLQFADWYYYAKAGDSTDIDDKEGYGMGNFFPVTINLEPAYALTDDLTVAAQLSFKINAGGSDQFGFGIKPSAEFSLGDGATFVVYDELVFWSQSKATKDDSGDFNTEHPGVRNVLQNSGTAGTTNALQFDFVWSF
jgi:hypothetical protein